MMKTETGSERQPARQTHTIAPTKKVVFRRKSTLSLQREIEGTQQKFQEKEAGQRKTCPVASSCQGCPSINLSYSQQLELKKANFTALLNESRINPRARIGSFEESTQKLHYRQTIKLSVSSKTSFGKTWIGIGLYKPGTHEVFDVGFCAAQDKELNGLIQTIKYALKDNSVAVHEQRLEYRQGRTVPVVITKGIRYIFARRSSFTGEILLTFVTSAAQLAKLKIVARQLKQRHPNLVGVAMHVNDLPGNQIFNHDHEHSTNSSELILGKETYLDRLAGLDLEVHPLAFFQVNPPVAERMYQRIWELAQTKPDENWIDVYCGIGTIGLGAAKRGARVIAIEEIAAATQQAKRNAELNHITNWSCIQGRAEDVMADEKLMRNHLGLLPVGVVSLNPSRRGCQPEVLTKVANIGAQTIIYMSCSQSTLFRDLERLESQGYKTRLIENFDMFPGTPHYETLVVLTKQAID